MDYKKLTLEELKDENDRTIKDPTIRRMTMGLINYLVELKRKNGVNNPQPNSKTETNQE